MKVIFFANTDWYLYNYRLPLARALRERGDIVTFLSPPGNYSDILIKEGFRWLPFNLERKGMNPFSELLTIKRLTNLLRAEKPDLTHFFTIKPVLYGSIAARLSGVPRIINAITGLGYIFSDANSLLRMLVQILYQFSLVHTSVIFQNSDDMNIFLMNKLIRANQAHLIPGSGVDIDIFLPVPEPEDIPVVMLAGRLLRSKGVPEFINAARLFRAEAIPARFVIVGEPYPDNPDSIQLQDLKSWEKEGIIENWGWHDDMAKVIAKSSIICLPTTYKEGLPRLLLEAGACGRPVIATDIPGCKMVIRNYENGILVQPGDFQNLIAALKKLVTDRDLRQRMGARGREIVVNEFSVNYVISQTFNIYNQK